MKNNEPSQHIVQAVYYEKNHKTIVFVCGHALVDRDISLAHHICKEMSFKEFKLTTFHKDGTQSTTIRTI